MKTIKSLIIGICIVSFLASCSEDETVYETVNSEINATGDQGDDVGNPNGKTGDQGDDVGNPDGKTGDQGDDVGNPDGKILLIITKDSIIKYQKKTGDQGDDIGNPR